MFFVVDLKKFYVQLELIHKHEPIDVSLCLQ